MWDRVPHATHYTVFWGPEEGNLRDLADAYSSSVVISGLRRGTLYSFAVSSWNERGESDLSPESVLVFDNEPQNATAHVAKGNELMREGALVDAYAYLTVAIRLDPDSAEAYRIRALLNEKLNRLDSAQKDYAMAEKLYNKKPMSRRQSLN
jgi:tetratricopeptide (TPR) repeat protein